MPDPTRYTVQPSASAQNRPIAALVVDCADPPAMSRFWSAAVDWTVHEVTDEFASLRAAGGTGPYLEFLRKPGEPSVWHRTHLDVVPCPGGDQAAEVSRLLSLGASTAGPGGFSWVVLTDPEGNEFCVLSPG